MSMQEQLHHEIEDMWNVWLGNNDIDNFSTMLVLSVSTTCVMVKGDTINCLKLIFSIQKEETICIIIIKTNHSIALSSQKVFSLHFL